MEEEENKLLTWLARDIEAAERIPFQQALASIEATRYQGSDGKWYVKFNRQTRSKEVNKD